MPPIFCTGEGVIFKGWEHVYVSMYDPNYFGLVVLANVWLFDWAWLEGFRFFLFKMQVLSWQFP